MLLLENVVRGLLKETLLLEGPIDKLRNMGIPEPFAKWFYERLPEYSKPHAHWYARELSDLMHQFNEYITGYKKAIKKSKKDEKLGYDMIQASKAVAKRLFEKWQDTINDVLKEIDLINNWAERDEINISSKKRIEMPSGGVVPFTFSSAAEVAKRYFGIEDEKIFMRLPGGWYWMDLSTNYCSIEAKQMGHCGKTDDSNSTLFSLRDEGGIPHITAEILFEEDGAIIKQMKGENNQSPNEGYHEMIYALLKNKNLKLKHYHAEGRHGGDLKWSDIPKEVQKEIEEIHEDTFDSSQEDSLNSVIRRAEEEIEERIQEFQSDFYAVNLYDEVDYLDEEEAYIRVFLSWNIELSEEIQELLITNREGVESALSDTLKHFNIDYTDYEISDRYAYGHIDDEDLSTTVTVENDDVDSIINSIGYWEREGPTQEEFLKVFRNNLVLDGAIEGEYDTLGVEELQNRLRNFKINIEEDPTDDDFGIVEATAIIGSLSDVKDYKTSMKIVKLVNDVDFARLFYNELSNRFAINLKQLILPYVDVGPIISVPTGATLYHYGSKISMKISFDSNKDNSDEFVDFLESMNKRIDQAQEIFVNLIKKELQYEVVNP